MNLFSARRKTLGVASNTYGESNAGPGLDAGLNLVIAKCRLGMPEAQHSMYEACHQAVFGLMVRMVGRQEAADVTQQVFLQVFRRIDGFAVAH
jgi:RNA polymerase sigma-70 factor (ECF subfamily)